MGRYFAYGLRLESPIPLPALTPVTGAPDVVVRPASLTCAPAAEGGRPAVEPCAQGLRLTWQGVATFEIRDGRDVAFCRAPEASDARVAALLVGPVLAVVLHQRGQLVLHASAVSRSAAAVAFLGEAGAGKSTLAGFLCARGFRVVADDFIGLSEQAPMLTPAFPALKLWPPAVTAVARLAPRIPLHEATDKAIVGMGAAFRSRSVRLRRLYVLAAGAAAAVEPMAAGEQVAALMRHSYGAGALHGHRPGAHFSRCAEVVRQIGVSRLVVPRTMDALSDVARLVLDDALAA